MSCNFTQSMMESNYHFPPPAKRLSKSDEILISIFSVVIAGLGSITAYMLLPKLQVPSFLPIALITCLLAPYLGLIIAGARNPFDMWAGFVYGSILAFTVSPIIHLITGETIVKGLMGNFEPLMRFVAWTSLPIVPLFYVGYRLGLKSRRDRARVSYYAASVEKSLRLSVILVVMGLLAQAVFYGVYRSQLLSGNNAGLIGRTAGTLLLVADLGNVGALLFVYAFLLARNHEQKLANFFSAKSLILLGLACLLVFTLNFFRGARSAILIYLVWATCLYIQFVRPIHILILITGLIVLLFPLTIYKQYKTLNYTRLDDLIFDPIFRAEQSELYNLDPVTTLAGDLGRYYIWMLYYQELNPNGRLELQWGKTYVAALLQPFPRWILANKPPGMIELTTDAEQGRGYYSANHPRSARIGGFWAEGYVNFGVPGIWLSSFFFGILLGKVKDYFTALPIDGIGCFFYGMFANWGLHLILEDSRLVTWQFVRIIIMAIPIFIFAGTRKKYVERSLSNHKNIIPVKIS